MIKKYSLILILFLLIPSKSQAFSEQNETANVHWLLSKFKTVFRELIKPKHTVNAQLIN